MFNDDAVVPKGDHPGDGLIGHMRQHDVIKTADWVIDLGPGGGVNGDEIVAEGPPEDVVAEPRSFRGQYLKPLLERASVRPELVEGRKAGAQMAKPKARRKAPVLSGDEGSADQADLIAAK